MNEQNESSITSTRFEDKAHDTYAAMLLLADDIAEYRMGIALCAVHTCILLNSAILAAFGQHTNFQDHFQAVGALENLCAHQKIDNKNGIRHLGWLISRKNKISYSSEYLDDNLVSQAKEKCDRFSRWAYTHFKEELRAHIS